MKVGRDESRFDFLDIGLDVKRAYEADRMTQEQQSYIVDQVSCTIMNNEDEPSTSSHL